jgi:hypothetical protein
MAPPGSLNCHVRFEKAVVTEGRQAVGERPRGIDQSPIVAADEDSSLKRRFDGADEE